MKPSDEALELAIKAHARELHALVQRYLYMIPLPYATEFMRVMAEIALSADANERTLSQMECTPETVITVKEE